MERSIGVSSSDSMNQELKITISDLENFTSEELDLNNRKLEHRSFKFSIENVLSRLAVFGIGHDMKIDYDRSNFDVIRISGKGIDDYSHILKKYIRNTELFSDQTGKQESEVILVIETKEYTLLNLVSDLEREARRKHTNSGDMYIRYLSKQADEFAKTHFAREELANSFLTDLEWNYLQQLTDNDISGVKLMEWHVCVYVIPKGRRRPYKRVVFSVPKDEPVARKIAEELVNDANQHEFGNVRLRLFFEQAMM